MNLWREWLMLVFFDELESGILPHIEQVSQTRGHAISFLSNSGIKLLENVAQIIRLERPLLLTAEVLQFLETRDQALWKDTVDQEITRRMQRTMSEISLQSIFGRIARLEYQDQWRKNRKSSPDVF